MDLDLSKVNTEEAKKQFEARKQMQEDHLENTYGPIREMEKSLADTYNNFAILNWVLTLHDFSKFKGMDYLNEVQKYLMVHQNSFEAKVKKMEGALGDVKMRELGIDPDTLYPSEYAARGLRDVQEEARRRARMNKYDVKVDKPKIIT